MKLVTEAFEGNKIEAVNHLSGVLEDRDKEQIVAMDSFGDKLQQLGTNVEGIISAIVGIISAIVSIITTIHI